MRLDDFIEKVEKTGWEPTHDAQHGGIERLWREIYPFSADIEDELKELEREFDKIS